MAVENHKDLAVRLFKTPKQMLAWLKRFGKPDSESIWIKIAKKGSGRTSVTYEQARETAIRYGWIDGLINKYDDEYYLIKFSPRRPRSGWSKINRGIAEGLIRDGKMEPPGQVQVDAAKADGRWDAAYDSPRTIQVPSDLKALLAKDSQAAETFAALSSADRYAFLVRLQTAKTDSTRTRRLKDTIDKLSRGESFSTDGQAAQKRTKKPASKKPASKKVVAKRGAEKKATSTVKAASKPQSAGKKTRYAVLLRGINVGGHRVVKMPELKRALSDAGLEGVSTYIQSGNIVCTSTLGGSEIAELVRGVIQTKWTFDVAVQAYGRTVWKRMLTQCPFDEPSKILNFVFLDKAAPKAKIESLVAEMLRPNDQFEVRGRVIYLLCPDGLGKSRFSLDTLEKKLGLRATSRNWNTVDRMMHMLSDG